MDKLFELINRFKKLGKLTGRSKVNSYEVKINFEYDEVNNDVIKVSLGG